MSVVVSLSLISHTNVGKTTLARTLLRRDVGEVRDAAHVTETSDVHLLVSTPQGDELRLWDTPGFGDSARLLRRLEQSGNPLGWFLTQVWDRYVDRPFFSSQQAVRNVREEADVVLYLVNASEDPAAAGYVDAEMQVLGWTAKPVVVLLNQLGPPRSAAAEAEEARRWATHLAGHPWVRETLAFDAFARCWVQEHALLERIAGVLTGDRRDAFERLAAAWRMRNRDTFERSMQVLAKQLATVAADGATVSAQGATGTVRAWVTALLGARARSDAATDAAMAQLAQRLDAAVCAATETLIALHGLSGRAAGEILQRMGSEYAVDKAADPGKASLIGAALSGALGGDATTVRWSAEFLTGRVAGAVLRYLAVAHFGRGRGDYVAGEYPQHWSAVVDAAISARRPLLDELWLAAESGTTAAALESRLRPQLEGIVSDVLARLYPTHA